MATTKEVERAFNIVLGAGLSFPPRADEIGIRVNAWCELLEDIPGEYLITAAKDIAKDGDSFPSVPDLRKQAAKVKSHNGNSAAPDHFEKPYARAQSHDYLDGKPVTVIDHYPVMIVTPGGWIPWKPTGKRRPAPTAFDLECARLEEKYYNSGLPTDDELYQLEMLREG